jgi:hypothetical protein
MKNENCEGVKETSQIKLGVQNLGNRIISDVLRESIKWDSCVRI